jgi:hypothetical protein
MEGKTMEPWIIEKIRDEEKRQQEEKRIQPHLPAPPPMWGDPPDREKPDRGSSIVDFEIKT